MNQRVLIVDDEEPARKRIRKMLSGFQEIEIIGEADNGNDAVKMINELKPDLVFLDIQMPGYTGLQVAENIKHHPVIIFVTAYDEYAVKAFDVNAVDYLLKPFSSERFEKAVEKGVESVKSGNASVDELETLIKYINSKKGYLERITVKKGYEYQVFDIMQADYFVIENGLLFMAAEGGKHLIDFSLNRLEENLDPEIFFRAHRKAVVNIKKVKKMITWGRGRYSLKFSDGKSIHLSRSNINRFKLLMGLQI